MAVTSCKHSGIAGE